MTMDVMDKHRASITCATDDELSAMFTNVKFTKHHRLCILREIVKRLEKLKS